MTSEQRRHLIQTRHGHMHVRTGGAGDGTPLVLLHMTAQSGRQFERVTPLLADRPLVLPDRIGFGDSDDLAAPMRLEDYAQATLDALDALGVGTFDVIGIHTGSAEAVELATAHPERVRRVGVVALPAFTDEERAFFRDYLGKPPEPQEDGSHLLKAWARARGALQPQLDGVRWTVDDVHRQTLNSLRAGPALQWTIEAVMAHETGELAQRIRQPFLVLAPHDDVWSQTERMLPVLPQHARVVDLPHMEYEVFALHPEELAGHIRAFLDEAE
jgi:pimeloyl-ACP methyl ester carboxylesterase